jgi:hypothetical protein
MINHRYFKFYNKISSTSQSQWILAYVHECHQLIFDPLSYGVIQETKYINGDITHDTIICHNFEFDAFCPFGFLDDFTLPTARPGNSASRGRTLLMTYSKPFTQVIYDDIG